MDEYPKNLTVPPEAAGRRLDQFLAAALPEASRARVQQVIADGHAVKADAAFRIGARFDQGEVAGAAAHIANQHALSGLNGGRGVGGSVVHPGVEGGLRFFD